MRFEGWQAEIEMASWGRFSMRGPRGTAGQKKGRGRSLTPKPLSIRLGEGAKSNTHRATAASPHHNPTDRARHKPIP